MFFAINFSDTNTGYAVGWKGTALKTLDGGETWQTMNGTNGANLFGVSSAPSTAVAVGSGTIFKE